MVLSRVQKFRLQYHGHYGANKHVRWMAYAFCTWSLGNLSKEHRHKLKYVCRTQIKWYNKFCALQTLNTFKLVLPLFSCFRYMYSYWPPCYERAVHPQIWLNNLPFLVIRLIGQDNEYNGVNMSTLKGNYQQQVQWEDWLQQKTFLQIAVKYTLK